MKKCLLFNYRRHGFSKRGDCGPSGDHKQGEKNKGQRWRRAIDIMVRTILGTGKKRGRRDQDQRIICNKRGSWEGGDKLTKDFTCATGLSWELVADT